MYESSYTTLKHNSNRESGSATTSDFTFEIIHKNFFSRRSYRPICSSNFDASLTLSLHILASCQVVVHSGNFPQFVFNFTLCYSFLIISNVKSEVVADPGSHLSYASRSCKKIHTTHIIGFDFPLFNGFKHGACDAVRNGVKPLEPEYERSAGRRSLPKVSEHHSRAKNHSGWVGTVSANDITGNMTTSWFEKRTFLQIAFTTSAINLEIATLQFQRCIPGRCQVHRLWQHRCLKQLSHTN